MKRINFQNGITKVNEDTFNEFQKNIEESTVIVSATEPTTGEKVWIQKGKNLVNQRIKGELYNSEKSLFELNTEFMHYLNLPSTHLINQCNRLFKHIFFSKNSDK